MILNERPYEYAFALQQLAVHWAGWKPKDGYPVADVGTGGSSFPNILAESWFDHIVAYDPCLRGMVRMPWHQQVQFVEARFEEAPWLNFAAITCLSTLEHVADPGPVIHSMDCRLMDGGLVVVTAPFSPADEFIEVQREEPVYGRPLDWWRAALPARWRLVSEAYLRYWHWTEDGWDRCAPKQWGGPAYANGFMWALVADEENAS